jgi:antitoxin (DNA-binding transcriptional repressor) of toxin-antitoxin stability system
MPIYDALEIETFSAYDENDFICAVDDMETVNALKLRNNFGEILDRLSAKGDPILISKGRKMRAVPVTPEDFERRFPGVKAQEEKDRLIQLFKSLRKRKKGSIQSLKILRQLRGYPEGL